MCLNKPTGTMIEALFALLPFGILVWYGEAAIVLVARLVVW